MIDADITVNRTKNRTILCKVEVPIYQVGGIFYHIRLMPVDQTFRIQNVLTTT